MLGVIRSGYQILVFASGNAAEEQAMGPPVWENIDKWK